MQLILVLFWFKPAVKKKKRNASVSKAANTKELGYTQGQLVLILEEKSFPNFPRKNSDHSRKHAAPPQVFYGEVPSDRDQNEEQEQTQEQRPDADLPLSVLVVWATLRQQQPEP